MTQLGEQDDEIDLGELFAAILHNWWVVCLTTFLSIFFAAYYIFNVAVPEFEASTRFELLDGSEAGPDLRQAATLSALAGINVGGHVSRADAIQDRVLSRPFIESIYADAEFASDPIFNARLRKPGLISQAIELIRGPAEEIELDRDDFLVMAVGGLRDRLVVTPGDNGIITLMVTHPDGERAAQVANVIVEQTLLDMFERERNETRESLNYFADELLQVRAKLDVANAAVRDYAITNNLQSAEDLSRTSVQLAQIRRDVEQIDESIRALEAMRAEDFSGAEIAQTHPVSTSLSFRRLMNLPGDPNLWEKPTDEQLTRAVQSLMAQKSPLISTFNALEERARQSGAEALELEALRREVDVQQAIYESVITQFETRSLASGYERASGRIVETAIAPNNPASPNKKIVLVLGVVFGFVVGVALAMIISKRRGLLYTNSAIKEAFALPGSHNFPSSRLGRLDRQGLTAKQLVAAQDFLATLDESDQIVPLATTASEKVSARFALGLSKASSMIAGRTAVLDLSQEGFGKIASKSGGSVEEDFRKFSISDKVDFIEAIDPNSFLKPSTCAQQLDRLKASYERIFVVLPVPKKGTAIAHRIAQTMDKMVIISKSGKTKRTSVDAIKSVYSKPQISDPLLIIT
ncbi:GNVR domain-containing protein [Shimia sp. R9_3]|uniref:GumC family protein n=1 Tax=Shimia sp. R9_3 TaxID=2821113 RepID=UPI001AD98F30|nr:GNVR domain-containing protein [Shimia sp. R9_3]MBO9399482.1 hypothetical protein [Shimia sp. R9_3]